MSSFFALFYENSKRAWKKLRKVPSWLGGVWVVLHLSFISDKARVIEISEKEIGLSMKVLFYVAELQSIEETKAKEEMLSLWVEVNEVQVVGAVYELN